MGGRHPAAVNHTLCRIARLFWVGATVLAVFWPGRFISPLEGIPLDTKPGVVLLGLIFPVLLCVHPRFLRTTWARGLISCLLLWKLVTAFTLTQEGWCVRFFTQDSLAAGGTRIQRSWDMRTDWRQWVPRCSAIMARGYPTFTAFPAWFVNLLDEDARPPHGTFTMEIEGYLTTTERGSLALEIGQGVSLKGFVGTTPIEASSGDTLELLVESGVHRIQLKTALSGSSWRFVPLWNGRQLWRSALTTVDIPSSYDRAAWKLGAFLTPVLITLLILSWSTAVFINYRPNPSVLVWTVLASVGMASIADGLFRSYTLSIQGHQVASLGMAGVTWGLVRSHAFAVILLLGCLVVPVSRHLRNLKGAFFLLGLPWLSLFGVRHLPQVGRFTLYTLKDDWLTFQRYAHRIFMEGYWLEGGEKTFYYQPLYRWINGTLHMIFGDSSVGEAYWDAFCLLGAALFCFHVVKVFAGFRWGLLAGAITLVWFTHPLLLVHIGRGLSEISAAGLAYLGAICLLRGRLRRWGWSAAAAVCASLAFYARLNHLPFVLAVAALSLPVRVPAREWFPVRALAHRFSVGVAIVFLGGLACGVMLFALRTWYYTGVFSLFYGTTRQLLSTGLGASTILSAAAWARALESVWMVMTVADPPTLKIRSIPVIVGVVTAGLALLRVPFVSRVPLGPSVLCVSAVVSSLLVRGAAYQGRFSIHLIPVAIAISVCVLALTTRRLVPKLIPTDKKWLPGAQSSRVPDRTCQ